MLAKDVMKKEVLKISPKESLINAAKTMVENKVSSLLVCENDVLKGIISHEDILNALTQNRVFDLKVEDIMSKNVICVKPETELDEIAELMAKHKITNIPVELDGKLLGIITASDLVKYEENLVEKLAEIFMSSRGPSFAG